MADIELSERPPYYLYMDARGLATHTFDHIVLLIMRCRNLLLLTSNTRVTMGSVAILSDA